MPEVALGAFGIRADYIAIIILLLVIVSYVTEIIPMAVTAVAGPMLSLWMGIAPAGTAFGGFSNDATWLVCGMIMVGASLFETGVAATVGNSVVKKIKNSETRLVLLFFPMIMVMSAFLNNTSCTATFMPIIRAIAANSGGNISAKRLLMPLAICSNCGGMLTLVGSTPPPIINGAMAANGLTPFGFFTFAICGLPVCVGLIFFILFIMPTLTNRFWKDEIQAELAAQTSAEVKMEEQKYDKRKMVTASLIMLTCIVLFVGQTTIFNNYFTLATVGLTGGMATVALGTMSLNRLFQLMDWNTFFLLSGSIGFANILVFTRADQLIANTVAAWVGDASLFVIFATFVILTAVLTQFMSNTACAAMMAPIGIFVALGAGMSPYPLMMAIASTAAASFVTPVANPSSTMVLTPGNYKFMDYVKVGGAYQVIAIAIIIAVCPIFWPLTL